MTVLPAVDTAEDKIWERDGRELEGDSVRQNVKVSMLVLAFKNLQGKVIYQIKGYSFKKKHFGGVIFFLELKRFHSKLQAVLNTHSPSWDATAS